MNDSDKLQEIIGQEQKDNRRRGKPIQGCDCVQCFGYCVVKLEDANRTLEHYDRRRRAGVVYE